MNLFYFGLAASIKAPFFGQFVGPVVSILMTTQKYGQHENSMYGFMLGVNYFAIFHAQGVFNQVFAREIKETPKQMLDKFKPLSIGAWFLSYALTCPTNHSDTGFLFYFPIYFGFLYQCLYVFGSWLWVYTLMWIGKIVITEKGVFYDTVVGSGMWAYVSHYLFIVLSSQYIVRPLNLGYYAAVICNYGLTELVILLTYRAMQQTGIKI